MKVLVFGLFFLSSLNIAVAHKWYPHECCHEKDCFPADSEPDAGEPEPTEKNGNIILHDGKEIPENQTRISPDGRYHVCRYNGDKNASVIFRDGKYCVWIPGKGV